VRRSPYLLASLLFVAACSSSTAQESSTSGGDVPTGVLPGYGSDVDETSPLIISTVAPDPIPVTGTDGKVHVAYELEVFNFSPRVATVTSLETLEGGLDGDVVASAEGEALADRMILVMDSEGRVNPEIPVGRTGLILVDDVYDSRDDVPDVVTHRLGATFAPIAPEYEHLGALFPAEPVSLIGGPVTTSDESPVVIGPPLAGPDWMAFNACCEISSHRIAMLPVGGRVNGAERYAIDWFRYDLTVDPTTLEDGLFPSFRGDPTENEDYLAYDEPLLAVADGTVVAVVSDIPDSEPHVAPTGLTLAELGGNVVTIDIGDGVYAFYAHLVPGSPTVQVGDKVTRGQIIGRLGNSGNSTETHLHFQLQRTISPLTGDNVPFEIDELDYRGIAPADGPFRLASDSGPRTDQLPLGKSVVDFPAVP
jgi:hypothetical protein